MFKNYLTIIYRSLLRNKILSAINIFCLAIGMAACLVIFLYVNFENSYDDYHENAGNIYRLIVTEYKENKPISRMPFMPCPLGAAMEENFPEVKEFARITSWGKSVLNYKNNSINVKKAFRADASFLRIFSFPFLKGNIETALTEPLTAVISESCAKKLFGDHDPINKVVVYKSRKGDMNYVIKGVFKDLPKNSHLKFDVLFSIYASVNKDRVKNNWNLLTFNLYIQLNENTDIKNLEAKLNKFLEGKYNDQNIRRIFSFQPVEDIHLYSGHLQWDGKRGSYKTVYFLSILALFIFIIAWINYIIITTANSMSRAGEVGVRKVLGATRKELLRQFLLESLFFNLLAGVVAVVLTQILLPYFNQFFNLNLSLALVNDVNFMLPLLALFLIGPFLAGIYPALILSAYKPVSILSSRIKISGGGNTLRKILVTFQIAISVFLIVGTLTVYKQIDYMRKQDLGINIDGVILIFNPTFLRFNDSVAESGKLFVEELKKYSEIKSVTSSNIPGEAYFTFGDLRRENSSVKHRVKFGIIDYHFLETYKPELIVGRNFSKEFAGDRNSENIFINEKVVETFDYESPEKALNQFIGGETKKFKIIGVIKNYHQVYLKEALEPVCFKMHRYSPHTYLSVKLNTKKVSQAIDLIKTKYKEHFPGFPFEYLLANEHFDRQYHADRQFGNMVGLLSLLAIFIACIGLWSLSLYTVSTRTKEIGIRKILGATFSQILTLLSKDYLRLIAISNIIALPIVYFLAKKWLENYAYRIELGWWFLVIPILIVMMSAFLTVGYNVFKIAISNPVNSLRYE